MSQISITKEKRAKRIKTYIERMPSLSTTVTKVLEICNRPDTSANDLNRVISLDPVLTGQVLKLINSAYYAFQNKVTSLTRAIIILGLNTVKNLALSTAILDTLGKTVSSQRFTMDDFWTHSIGVGVTAKALAKEKKVQIEDLEEFFVGGLLHDLGKIPLTNRFPEDYVQALESAKLSEGPVYRAENDIFEIDHGMVGEMIAEKWNLDKKIKDALRYHHQPEETGEDSRSIVGVIALANLYVNMLELGSSGEAYPEKERFGDFLEQAEIDGAKLSELREGILEKIEEAKIFMQVAQKVVQKG
jgi:putative nucleotidyltransferase with HDIG domain